MPTPDDAFVQNLTRLAGDVAPTIAVDTSRVVATARSRRDRRRSLAAGAFGVAVLGGVAITQVPAWTPAWTTTPQVAAHETHEAPPARTAFGVPSPEDVAPGVEGDEPSVPAPMSLDADAADAADGLPTPAVAALGAAGAAALGAGAYFAVRSRRHLHGASR
jgi:hypothetical protein